MKLKICMLLPRAYQSIPLRTEMAEVFGKHLRKKGHDVFAIISSDNSRKYDWEGVKIYEISSKRKVGKICLAQRIIEEENCNLVLARNTSIDGVIGLYLRWKYGIPLVFQYTWPSLEAWKEKARLERKNRMYIRGLKQKVEGFLQIEVMCRADLVISTSKWMKEYLVLKGVPRSKILPFPNGVNPILFSSTKTGVKIRTKYMLGSSPVIVYSGTIDTLRQLDFLIHAFRKVKDKVENAKLLMVGDGDDRCNLEKLAAELKVDEDVVFTGMVPYFEVPNFLAASDVAVSPIPASELYKVSSPLKIFEYMSAGKPVVANKEIPEQNETIQESNGGLLVPYNEGSFADAITKLLKDPCEKERLSKNGRNWVLKNRTYEKLAQELEAVLFSLLNSKSR